MEFYKPKKLELNTLSKIALEEHREEVENFIEVMNAFDKIMQHPIGATIAYAMVHNQNMEPAFFYLIACNDACNRSWLIPTTYHEYMDQLDFNWDYWHRKVRRLTNYLPLKEQLEEWTRECRSYTRAYLENMERELER